MEYRDFIAQKHIRYQPTGFEPDDMNPHMFDFQRDISRLGCMRGRFGGFLACGLGKALCQLECSRQFVRHTRKPTLLLAPLAVAQQAKRESDKFSIDCNVKVCKDASDVEPDTICLANYERLHKFDADAFGGIVLDEGSCVKAFDSKLKADLVSRFSIVPYRQTWTATPAPNDYMEMGNQAEYLGIMRHAEMLAAFFVNDGGDTSKWMLRGHAKGAFWEWMASWSVMIQSPADLGYDASRYALPEIEYHEHIIEGGPSDGMLFSMGARGLSAQRKAMRDSMELRIEKAASLVASDSEPWVVWCNMNEEGERLAKAIPGSIEVAGRHSVDEKEERLLEFINGKRRVLIIKPKIGGFGLNLQFCRNTVIFPTNSWEQWHQMIRRFYRFGQDRTVNVHAVLGEEEMPILENIMRKERDAEAMAGYIKDAMAAITQIDIKRVERKIETYLPTKKMRLPQWAKAV